MRQGYPDISDILQAKQQRRLALAALSWEEKVAIIEPMQPLLPGGQWKSRTIREQGPAHIIAHEPAGPRGHSVLSDSERDSYYNLILLCPTHHRIVDENVEDYPTEKLHMIKAQHELWVRQSPDPRYCSAFGGTPDEALREVQIAKQVWLEAAIASGKPIPEPRYRPVIYQLAA